ncbi:MAG: hypothetical protein IT381_18320 [Deltaproteobacteria bacterium]|nr:hypothetical protein [Deltaproteobacteria bacterium]
MLRYWRRIFRFALLGRLPRTADELPIWALTVPFSLWRRVVRADGRTFEDLHAGATSRLLRRVLPLRAFYLVFLCLWPFVAIWRALLRGRGFLPYWRMTMSRPELSLQHPHASYRGHEVEWSRPDYTIGMFYAFWFVRQPAAFFGLDDKREFVRACRAAGLPIPETLTREEAIARGGEVVVKEATSDLGYGVTVIDGKELAEIDEPWEKFVIQVRLKNHRALLAAYPETAPLSSFRVMTMLDPVTKKPFVIRTAVRIGRAGSPVDNTQQGGIWSRVDMKTGEIQAGVTRKTFGVYRKGEPVREGVHPDTGRSFVGLRVPWWDEGQALALKAHETLAPEALSLGFDVALCEGAPVLLEVNVWTVLYDYDPDSDAFTPAAALMLEKLREW